MVTGSATDAVALFAGYHLGVGPGNPVALLAPLCLAATSFNSLNVVLQVSEDIAARSLCVTQSGKNRSRWQDAPPRSTPIWSSRSIARGSIYRRGPAPRTWKRLTSTIYTFSLIYTYLDLPIELLEPICENLATKDLVNVSQVDWSWHAAAARPLWRCLEPLCYTEWKNLISLASYTTTTLAHGPLIHSLELRGIAEDLDGDDMDSLHIFPNLQDLGVQNCECFDTDILWTLRKFLYTQSRFVSNCCIISFASIIPCE